MQSALKLDWFSAKLHSKGKPEILGVKSKTKQLDQVSKCLCKSSHSQLDCVNRRVANTRHHIRTLTLSLAG